ncbi:MAG: FAD-binding protein [Saprospiraceae bacterium]|nr:FAD-binding protein [Saprospiraceae bacterium]
MWRQLQEQLAGELHLDEAHLTMFATDASAYKEMPVAVAFPKHATDVQLLVRFAREHQLALIPRAAGTSLAGQVVGNGIVVDCSRYMNQIIELNVAERWVKLEPGVIRDELNLFLKPHGLFFGPETSTSNYCTVGGMLGNNSCGTRSIKYGSVRDHILEVDTVLSDGSLASFYALSSNDFEAKQAQEDLEGEIYKSCHHLLRHPNHQKLIQDNFPESRVSRRNTGYALDAMLDMEPYAPAGASFNFCKLLAGSEGTLAFTTSLKLNLVPTPPPQLAVVAVHCHSVAEACKGNLAALKYSPSAIELMDDIVIELARKNPLQEKNSDFLQALPKAVLLVEFAEESKAALETKIQQLQHQLEQENIGYHAPVLYGEDTKKAWELRKAGLGVLGNMPGDEKPVAVTEDTAVAPEVLPDYVADFEAMMHKHGKQCVYYAHISVGELHLRPVLNLKLKSDQELFRTIALESAQLVKKYKGSISGEHGDGRLRGEFIPLMLGEATYGLLQQVKQIWDPQQVFNPQKIVDTPVMNSFLRYEADQETRNIDTMFDFSGDQGILRAVEKCNGTGACRKTEVIGGTMCPSYMATRNEKDTTRARANVLREFLTNSPKKNPFNHGEIKEVMDLCLSCKACKTECPSSVDMTKLKAEFLQQYYTKNGAPIRARLIAQTPIINKLTQSISPLVNAALSMKIAKKMVGFAPARNLPKQQQLTVKKWFRKRQKASSGRLVYLLNDEFINYYDTSVGKAAVGVLEKLGYSVKLVSLVSTRTHLSKGFLRKAKGIIEENVNQLYPIVSAESPLLGLEPSTIITFLDENIDLTRDELQQKAKALSQHCMSIETFLAEEMRLGRISRAYFSDEELQIKLHGHCMQKASYGTAATKEMLAFPAGVTVEEIPSGCCGMAGSFGYEAEHFEVSMKIGELVLFPEVRKSSESVIWAAPGTSCRHQIKDGTGRSALHPIEVLHQLLV